MSKKLPPRTPWFDGSVKPVRCGVYEQKSATGVFLGYQYWGGGIWYAWSHSIDGAVNRFKSGIKADYSHQRDPWRGLTKEAK